MSFFGLLGNKSAPAAEAAAAAPATETSATETTEAAAPAASQSLLEQHKDLWQPATTEQTEVPPLTKVS